MRKITLLACLLMAGFHGHSQTFWTENFGTSSTSGTVTSYTGPNGAWTETASSTATYSNVWYVSCQEQGHVTGVCGDQCSSSSGLGPSLHLGASAAIGGDAGAAYFSGSGSTMLDATTDRRAESPTINCTGKSSITLNFYYIENGDGTNDDGTVYYYDGTTWSPLTNPAKTSVCSSGQGQWARASVSLPASANNNPNVKIGFRWVNNNDAAGTDPSYAVDSVSLYAAGSTASAPVASFTVSDSAICQDSCLTLTSTTTGTVDSIRWMAPGLTGTAATTSPASPCFPTSGTISVKLFAWHGTAVDSTTHTIIVSPAPHPVVTASGHTLSVSGTYSSYQWYNGSTAITGATMSSYTYSSAGVYTVRVDSGSCKGTSAGITGYLGISNPTGTNTFTASQTSSDGISLMATQTLDNDIQVMVYDATGRQLSAKTWATGSTKLEISTGNLPAGFYLIKLYNSTTNTVIRHIKQ